MWRDQFRGLCRHFCKLLSCDDKSLCCSNGKWGWIFRRCSYRMPDWLHGVREEGIPVQFCSPATGRRMVPFGCIENEGIVVWVELGEWLCLPSYWVAFLPISFRCPLARGPSRTTAVTSACLLCSIPWYLSPSDKVLLYYLFIVYMSS